MAHLSHHHAYSLQHIYSRGKSTYGSEYAWIIPEYAWIYLIMSGHARICMNMPKSAWTDFVLDFPYFPIFFYNPLSTWTHDYLFECLQETRVYSLKIHGAVFLKRQNLIFPVAAGSTWFVFFRLHIFTSKIETYCYLLRGVGLSGGLDWWLWIWIYPSSVLFFLSQKL